MINERLEPMSIPQRLEESGCWCDTKVADVKEKGNNDLQECQSLGDLRKVAVGMTPR
jgi:hypothetical protein